MFEAGMGAQSSTHPLCCHEHFMVVVVVVVMVKCTPGS